MVLALDRVRAHLRLTAKQWGTNVRNRRLALGLTQAQLVEMIGDGITPQTVSKIEQGQLAPRDYLKVTIAYALMVEPSAMFPLPSRDDVSSLDRL